MNSNIKEMEAKIKIKKMYKPNLTFPILQTFVSLSVYGGFWLDLLDENYRRIGILSIVSVISTFALGIIFTSYFYRMFNYKKELKEHKKYPDRYHW